MSQKITRLFYLSFISLANAASSAHAGQVSNLTREPQSIEIREYEGWVPVTIAPYGNYSSFGPFYVKYHNQEVYLRENMEYAIWPEGVFGPQRVVKRNRRSY